MAVPRVTDVGTPRSHPSSATTSVLHEHPGVPPQLVKHLLNNFWRPHHRWD